MGQRGAIFAIFLCYAHATLVQPDPMEMERFTAAESKSGRMGPYKTIKENMGYPASGRQQTGNIVYGKSTRAARPSPQAYLPSSIKGKPVVGKFKPSQEETSYDTEPGNSFSQGYKPSPQETAALQKYMQRYASQVFNAQKHSSQLSENQKHVISSDPYKKYAPPQKFKFSPMFNPEPAKPHQGERQKDYDTVEINTEKYQAQYQVHQQISVQPKSHPKKAYSLDSSLQPSDYKENSQLAQQLFEEPEKSSWGYEPLQYGVMTLEKTSDLSKVTGYKIPAATSISLGHSVETKEEHKGHEDEEEHHYPHHEPKYEYMYQVHDPEKHNNFGHSEARKGKNTWGRYYVQLPDGRLETVKYWVDKSGYHAEVDFKGEAKHPTSSHTYKEPEEEYQHQEPDYKYFEHSEQSSPSFPKSSGSTGLGQHESTSFSLSDALPLEEYKHYDS